MTQENNFTPKDLEDAISDWKEAVTWIAKGWDGIEEYTHDLSFREDVDEVLQHLSTQEIELKALLERLAKVDEGFRKITVASNLCVWHTGPQFRHYPNGQVELTFRPYDRNQYWYYYRWQPDSPYRSETENGIGYQKKAYGLDFEIMSESELACAARREVATWEKKLSEIQAGRQAVSERESSARPETDAGPDRENPE